MAKKNKPGKTTKASPQPAKGGEGTFVDEPISPRGWRVVAGGVLLVAAGFAVLTQADAMGRNWAATVSPLLILAGYALVGLGIFAPTPQARGESSPSSLPPAQP